MAENRLVIEIDSIPIAKQSMKFNRKTGRSYTPANKVKAGNEYKKQILSQMPAGWTMLLGPVKITKLHFIFRRPERLKAKEKKAIDNKGLLIQKPTRPDMDNLLKLLFDSMNDIVFKDDSQVSAMDGLRKYYGKEPKIIIELEY